VAGQLRRRHPHRPGRGSGVQGVRGDQRARRGAWRDGHDVPAREDPGRVDVLRAQEARWVVAADRGEYVPAQGSWRGDCYRDRVDPVDRRREGPADRQRQALRRGAQRAGLRQPQGAAGDSTRSPQRVRAADRGGEVQLVGADQSCALRCWW